MATTEKLDRTDLLMLRALQENARLTIKELASRVNLSSTPVFDRFKKLEERGYIKKYITVLNEDKLNCGFVVFCNVKMSHINSDVAQMFTDAIKNMPEVSECYNISGNFDFLLKVNVGDMKAYRDFILHKLGQVEGVASIESVFVMNEIKHSYGINLPEGL